MDTDKDRIMILINQLDDFLYLSVYFHAYQATKLTDTVINVYDIITWCKLIQLF